MAKNLHVKIKKCNEVGYQQSGVRMLEVKPQISFCHVQRIHANSIGIIFT